MMKRFNRPVATLAGLCLLSSSFVSPAHAAEVSTNANNAKGVYDALLIVVDQKLKELDNELKTEVQDRITMDTTIRGELNTRINATNAKIAALEATIPPLSTKVEGLSTNVTNELNVVKGLVAGIRSDMNTQVNIINNAISQVNADMGANAANLQNQINYAQARLNDLYGQLGNINTRVNNVSNLLNDVYNRLTALRNCISAGGCVGQRPPTVQFSGTFSFDPGDSAFLETRYYNTGLNASEWQYCSIAGSANMGGRNLYTYISGNTWWMAGETDNWGFGDIRGPMYMNCMKIT